MTWKLSIAGVIFNVVSSSSRDYLHRFRSTALPLTCSIYIQRRSPTVAFPSDISLALTALTLCELLLGLPVPMLDQFIEEAARFALRPSLSLRLGELFLEMLLGLFVDFFVVVEVVWEALLDTPQDYLR